MVYKSLKVEDLFNFEGQVAALTGTSGYFVGTLSRAFGENGVNVALLSHSAHCNEGQK